MNITSFSDYTLRVLIYLAVHDDRKVTAQGIADSYDISFHHAAKAAQWLVRQGYVKSERGRRGGISLKLSADKIRIGDVVQATEAGSVPLVECMGDDRSTCCIQPACGLKHALYEAQIAFYQTLNKFTLADVATKKSALSQLLMFTA